MRIRTLCLAMLFILVLGVAQAQAAPYPPMGVKELGETVAGAKGKVVLVNVFASWCGPCREEIPGLINIRKQLSKDEFLIVGVSVDEDLDDLSAFLVRMNPNYPVYVAGKDLIGWAGISSIPHMFIYDKEGKLAVSHAGFVPEADLREFLEQMAAGQVE